MQLTKPLCLVIAILAASFTMVSTAGAEGGQHYPNGVEDFMVGALPPPGTYLVNYLGYIKKDTLMDPDGNDTGLDFDADVIVEVPRFIWVSDKTILGASWAAHIFIPFHKTDVKVKAGGTTVDDTDSAGLGDIIVSPFILGWHFSPNFHMVATIDTFIPTGDYDENDSSSKIISRNHWTFEPVLAVTYLTGGFDFSAKFMYDFSTDNDDFIIPGTATKVELSPGDEFHFDWAIGYMTGDFEFGLNGFQYWQVSEDEYNGVKQSNSKGKIGAIGPAFKWWPGKGRFSATLKHMQEFGAENMPEGHQTWLKIAWVI
jgi:hypothetical protein